MSILPTTDRAKFKPENPITGPRTIVGQVADLSHPKQISNLSTKHKTYFHKTHFQKCDRPNLRHTNKNKNLLLTANH